MKDSFILYTSFYEPLKYLSDEQMGKLFRAIFEYEINGNENVDNDIRIAFEFIKNQLNIDAAKWNDERNKRSEAGKKHTGNQYTRHKNKTEQMEQCSKCSTEMEQNGTNGTNGTDNVNENVNENVNKKENIKEKALSETDVSASDTAKASKHKYGSYKHVLLKDEELQALKRDFANWEELITYLDEYIEMKGYKAKSHYLAIKKWVVDAVKKPKTGVQNAYKTDIYSDFSNFYAN